MIHLAPRRRASRARLARAPKLPRPKWPLDQHRRDWVRDLIRQAAGSFAVDVLAYAVMSNHLYIVVLTDPNRVVSWSPAEVATRWASAHPRTGPDGNAQAWRLAEIAEKAADPAWIATARTRLRSLSWFMKCITERLARRSNRANRDDGCTGHFWEGRFRSVRRPLARCAPRPARGWAGARPSARLRQGHAADCGGGGPWMKRHGIGGFRAGIAVPVRYPVRIRGTP